MTQAAAERRNVDWDRAPFGAGRSDLLVHALAQLPDDISFEMSVEAPNRRQLQRLALAYGISNRLIFRDRARFGAEAEPIPGVSTMAELVESLSQPEDPPASCRRSDEIFQGHRIAVVTNLPAPYRIPLFNRMAERLTAADAGFRVLFLAGAERGRPWMAPSEDMAFEREQLSALNLPLRKRGVRLPLNLERRLAAFGPSLLLSAGFSPFVSGRASAFAHRRGIPFGLWSGEHMAMTTASNRMRRGSRRQLAASADFAIAYGFLAGEYLRSLRPDLPLVYGRNTSVVQPARSMRRTSSVAEIIAVGDLTTTRKGIDVLIDALRLVPDLRCRVTVIGGGAQLATLQRRASGDDRISFTGHLPSSHVRLRYLGADVFAFPSRADVFGLAPVEAMAAGLAMVISGAPGVIADLCIHERNCIIVDGFQPQAWANALRRLVDDHVLRKSIGELACRTIMRRWTIEHAADAMIAGLRLGLLPAGDAP